MQEVLHQQISAAGLTCGETLLVAVSGGLDSMVLLQLLCEQAEHFGLSLRVAHLDHQLRPESSADAEFVRGVCKKLGIPCQVESCDVGTIARQQQLSLEMAGRQARREFLLQQADAVGARLIALAHHSDDQAETLLLRLLRGSGPAGLAGMRSLQGRWWRPLLGCSRAQLYDFACRKGMAWVEDVSNRDPIFLRNRVRHQLLPEMQAINPRIVERLTELCRQLQDDEDYWEQQIAALLPGLIVAAGDGLRLDRGGLLALPSALRMRVVRLALQQLRGDLLGIESVHLRAIDDLLSGERSQAQLDLPGCWAARRYEVLWLRLEQTALLPDYDLALPLPGVLTLPCGRELQAQLRSVASGESALIAEFSREQLAGPLRVRNWRPGDSFSPQGLEGSKQLKRLFSDQKIELEERRRVPLLLCGKRILWVVGMRRSGHATVGADRGEILRLELLGDA